MFSIFLVPVLCVVLGALFTHLAYRRSDDGGPAKVPRFFRTAWVLPIVVPVCSGILAVQSMLTYGPSQANTGTIVAANFFIPLAYLLAFMATRAREDRTSLFVWLTACAGLAFVAALLPAFLTSYSAYRESLVAQIVTVVMALFPVMALAYGIHERRQVTERAFMRIGVPVSEAAPLPTAGARLRAVWFVPLVPAALIGLLTMLALGGMRPETWITDSLVVIDLLVPLAFVLGYLATRDRWERRALLVTAAAWLVLGATAIAFEESINSSYLYARSPYATILTLALCFYPIAALLYALWQRRAVIQRTRRRVERVTGLGGSTRSTRRVDGISSGAMSATRQASPDASGAAVRSLLREVLGDDAGVPATAGGPAPEAIATAGEAAEPGVAHVVAQQVAAPAAIATPATALAAQPADPVVDVNTCTEMDLLALPGMTVSIARAAVAERDDQGPYASVEDFVRRNSLKPHLVVMFIDRLSCSQPSARAKGARRSRTLDL